MELTDFAFAFVIGCGASLGLAWAAARAESSNASSILNAGLCALAGAYLGGRLANLLVYQVLIPDFPETVFQIPMGGFAWPGSLLGGIVGMVVYALATRQPTGPLADGLIPLLVTLPICAWLGSWLIGYAYGAPVEAWWGILSLDEWGVVQRRWPVQPTGALLSLLVLWVIDQLPSERLPPGAAFVLSILGISMVNFFMSLLRVDPAPMANGLRLETWVALAYGAACLLALIALMLISRRIKATDLHYEGQPPETP